MDALVAGRACGECTVCCTVLLIDTEELQKDAGVTCGHCAGGCAIHATRPPVCREFFCAWRTLEILPTEWRPDKSGIFAQLESEDIPPQFAMRTGISLMLTGDHPTRTLRQKGFTDFVASGVREGIPLFLSLPGPPGHQAAKLILNTDEMRDALASPLAGRIKDVLEKTLKRLAGHAFKAALLKHRPPA